MPRNLVRRIELLTAIKDEKSKDKIFQILKMQISDNTLAHELQSDGSYIKVKNDGQKSVNNHRSLEDYVNRISRATKKESVSSIEQLATRLFIEG
jgi:polyphosphate kinase